MSRFDIAPERRGTGALKWDAADRIFGGKDILPMWIADMDFAVAPPITEAMKKRLEHPVFGYGMLRPEYYQAVIDFMLRRHQWPIKREWICFTPGVVAALDLGVQVVSQPDDEIMVATPVYGPFYSAVEKNGRKVIKTPLKKQGELVTFDFDAMEKLVTPRTKAFMLCSPHNPVGRVWHKEELCQLAAFCEKHQLKIIDDEIHHDLILEGEHIVFAKISEYAQENSIICTAPSKTFNIAGLQASNIIIPNEEMFAAFKKLANQNHMMMANSLVESAVIAAYTRCDDWLDELIGYLRDNRDYLHQFIEEKLPMLSVFHMAGTYLAWINCEKLGFGEEELKHFMGETCGLGLNAGKAFGEDSAQFVRMNLACPRVYIEKACAALEKGIKGLKNNQ